MDAGDGNAQRELYHYGARWYLPGVGIFTQAYSIVPEPGNPQALNRYSYVYNNPLKHVDPSGHNPTPADALTATPLPVSTPTPFPTGASTTGQGGPVTAQLIPSPVPAPTPTPRPQPSPRSTTPATPGPTLGAIFSKLLVNAYGNPATNRLSTISGLGQSINTVLGVALGELGGGQRRIGPGPGGTLIFENVQGISRGIITGLNGGKDSAITVGNVIVSTSRFDLTTPESARWLAHEVAHVGHSGALGILYLPVYGVGWLFSGGEHDAHLMESLANEYRDEYSQQYQIQAHDQQP